MVLLPPPDVYGYTIFCDDIRSEADGKISYIGAYGGHMFVHVGFPITLPKFGFAMFLFQRIDDFVPELGIRIFLPGDPDEAASIQAQMGEVVEGATMAQVDAQKSAVHPAANLPEDSPMVSMQANLVLAPLVIKEPGQIRVRAVRKGDLVRLGGMTISPVPQKPTSTQPA